MSEFDAERAELFLARGALLVEGRTEKLAFPFVFRALGHDVDERGDLDRRVRRQVADRPARARLRPLRDPVRRRPRP